MADESTQSIVIDAPPERIMAVIADFDAYPTWATSVKTCEVLLTGSDGEPSQVRFVLDAGVIKDTYVLAYTWASSGMSVRWELVSGQVQTMQRGSYELTPEGTVEEPHATRVTYTLAVALNIPMLGMFKRKAEKMIMDTALKELKRRVETS